MMGWRRIGIALSVIWLIAAPIYMLATLPDRAVEHSSWFYRVCRAPADSNPIYCSEKAKEVFANWQRVDQLEWRKTEAVILAILPIPFAWLAAWIAIRIGRWIRAGFKAQASP